MTKKVFMHSVLLSVIFSCFAASPKNGLYMFNYERILNSVDVQQTYSVYGIEARQDIIRKVEGCGVLIENGMFLDPESGIEISISPAGKISSPENPTIQGKYKNNGEITFYGFYEENNQTIQITLTGVLISKEESRRGGKSLNGIYETVDNGSGKSQKVVVSDGLYTWEFKDEPVDSIQGWPVIVEPDGSFKSSSEYITRAIMKGMSDTVVSSKTMSFGKVFPNGSISIRTITLNNGYTMGDNQEPLVFNGKKSSEEIDKKSGANVYDKFKRKKKKSRYAFSKVSGGTMPDWYFEEIHADGNNYLSCAMKSFAGDESMTQKLAESVAVAQIISYLGTEVKAYQVAYSSAENDKSEKYLYKTIDALNDRKISYELVKSYYDKKSKVMYVCVKTKQ